MTQPALRLDAPARRLRGPAGDLGGGRLCRLLNPLFAPSPSRIGAALVELFSDGRIWPHLEATFTAALGGLVLGIVVGIVLGVVAALIPAVAELLEPVMTLLNAIPRVILAPLFVIWLGIGLASKVALVVHPGRGADLLHGVQRHPPGRPQAGRAHHHARRRPLGRWCVTSICPRSPPGSSATSRSRSASPSPAPASASSWPPAAGSAICSRSRRAPTTRR